MIKAKITRPRPSEVVFDQSAVDFDVMIDVDGTVRHGEITLAPDSDGVLSSFGGAPAHWCSQSVLRAIQHLEKDNYKKVLDALENLARTAVKLAGFKS